MNNFKMNGPDARGWSMVAAYVVFLIVLLWLYARWNRPRKVGAGRPCGCEDADLRRAQEMLERLERAERPEPQPRIVIIEARSAAPERPGESRA